MPDPQHPSPRAELEARAANGSAEAADGLSVLDAAGALVAQTAAAVSEAMALVATAGTPAPVRPTVYDTMALVATGTPAPARPTAAQVAKHRPITAEPKPDVVEPALVTIIASGAKAPREDAYEEVVKGLTRPRPKAAVGKEYLIGEATTGSWATLTRDPDQNANIIADGIAKSQEARQNGEALTAALGCAPSQPLYDFFPSISSGTAGVVDLPVVSGPRGSVTISEGFNVYDLLAETGVGDTWSGGSKTCFEPDCGTPREFDATAVFSCMTLPNEAMAFAPERFAALVAEARRAHEHAVNANLLAAIDAEAVPIGDPAATGGGATVRLYSSLALTANWFRAKYRADLNLKLEAIIPAWVAGVIQSDQPARDSTTDPGVSLDQLNRQLARIGINAQWVYDYRDGGLTAPTPDDTVDVLLFPAGTVSRLQGATLDLGVVRDVTLNAMNKFQWFVESWEGVVFGGPKPVQIVGIDLCANGETGNRGDITCLFS